MPTFHHPVSNAPIIGRQLQAGEVLRASDLYDSSAGHWLPCPHPGAVLVKGDTATWIRPGDEAPTTSLAGKPVEIVVGDRRLRLPPPWHWQQRGGWSAVNEPLSLAVFADLRGDEGIQICVQGDVPGYVPMVVLALTVFANEGGFSDAFRSVMRYVSEAPPASSAPS